jgi:hypothetical protein
LPLFFFFSFRYRLLALLPRSVAVGAVVTVLLLEEQLLCNKVYGECACRNAETGEGALEAVEAGEGTCVSPLLAVPR